MLALITYGKHTPTDQTKIKFSEHWLNQPFPMGQNLRQLPRELKTIGLKIRKRNFCRLWHILRKSHNEKPNKVLHWKP